MHDESTKPFGLPEQTRRSILEVFSAIPALRWVKVYGSRAVGTYHPVSTIDFAYSATEDLTGRLRALLDALPLVYQCDVTHYDTLQDEERKRHIDEQGQWFYRHPDVLPVIDISIPVHDGMIAWPGDPPVEVTLVLDVANGDPATVRRLHLGSHTGTHVDAPCHFLAGAPTLDDIPLTVGLGPAQVVAVDPQVQQVTAACLQTLNLLPGCERVLFRTGNSTTRWYESPFNQEFVHLNEDAAQWLVASGVRLVGWDYLSVESFYSQGAPVHKTLLAAGVVLLEGLNLCDVEPGRYTLTLLPLRLQHGDGAPARAVLQPAGSL